MASLTSYSDGIFNIGVNTMLSVENFAFSIISRRWVEIVSYINDTRLFWSDVFLKDVSDILGRSIYLPEVIVEHERRDEDRGNGVRDITGYEYGVMDKRGRWTKEYKKLHSKVVSEVVEKLKPHLDSNIQVKPVHTLRNALLKSYRKGQVYFQEGVYIEALKEFDKALSLEPRTDIIGIKNKIIYYKGMIYLNQQRYDEAIELLEEFLESVPGEIGAWYTLGSCYQKRREWEKAIENFNQVLSLETNNKEVHHAGAHFHLGEIYKSLEDKDKARFEFEECLKLNPMYKKAKEDLKDL